MLSHHFEVPSPLSAKNKQTIQNHTNDNLLDDLHLSFVDVQVAPAYSVKFSVRIVNCSVIYFTSIN